jgi:cell division transport system permease protein
MNAIATVRTHIRRSPYQALAAILSMFLTLLVMGIFTLSSVTSYFIIQYFEGKPQANVFFVENAEQKDIEALRTKLEETKKTSLVKFVSKDEALLIYKEQYKNDPLLIELVTADILPASLEVTASDPRYFTDLEPIMRSGTGVDKVIFQRDVVDTLLSWTNAFRLVGGIFGLLLSFNAVLIIMTITAMKVAMKKDEIEILKLIGASPWYIKKPFLLEAGFYGVVGGTVSFLCIATLLLWFRQGLLSFLGVIPEISTVLFSALSASFLIPLGLFFFLLCLSGFFLGAIGSLIALSKYTKL